MKNILIAITTFMSVASHASFTNVNPNLGAYRAKAYAGHDASISVRAGSCAVKVIEKKFDENGSIQSVEVIYKSSRSKPKTIILTRIASGELVGSAFNDREAYTSENPVIEMIGSGSSFGILISTRLNSNAAIVGMDGERQCHNLEENPMTVEEFDKY